MRFLALIFLFVAAPVFAQSSAAEDSAVEDSIVEDSVVTAEVGEVAARDLFERGTQAYEEGRNRDALSYFVQVHELTGRVEILFNIGLAHQRLGNVSEARSHYERYLLAETNAANRADVEQRLSELRALEGSTDLDRVEERNPVEERDPSLGEAPPPRIRRGPLFIGVAGAMLTVAGVVPLALGVSRTGSLDDSQGREWSDVADEQEGARKLQLTGVTIAAIGVALATTALIWALVARKSDTPEDLAWHF